MGYAKETKRAISILRKELEKELGVKVTTELLFHPIRKWRFDLAIPDKKIAIEVDGRGRHQNIGGEIKDFEKLNAALEYGWRVLKITAQRVRTVKRRLRFKDQVVRVYNGITSSYDSACVLTTWDKGKDRGKYEQKEKVSGTKTEMERLSKLSSKSNKKQGSSIQRLPNSRRVTRRRGSRSSRGLPR